MATDVLAVPILNDVEVLDFCVPVEDFSVASRLYRPARLQRRTRGREGRVGPDPWLDER